VLLALEEPHIIKQAFNSKNSTGSGQTGLECTWKFLIPPRRAIFSNLRALQTSQMDMQKTELIRHQRTFHVNKDKHTSLGDIFEWLQQNTCASYTLARLKISLS